MPYRVHRVEVDKRTVVDELERFLDRLSGEVVSVVPWVTPVFMPFGGSSRTTHMLIVERTSI